MQIDCPLCRRPTAIIFRQGPDGTPTGSRYLAFHAISVRRPTGDGIKYGAGRHLLIACPLGGQDVEVAP